MCSSTQTGTQNCAILALRCLPQAIFNKVLPQLLMTPPPHRQFLHRAWLPRKKAPVSRQQPSSELWSIVHRSSSSSRSTVVNLTCGPSDVCSTNSWWASHPSLTWRETVETQFDAFFVSESTRKRYLNFLYTTSQLFTCCLLIFSIFALENQPDLRLIRIPGNKTSEMFLCDLISRLLAKDPAQRP